jgi:hypothetical protein
MSNHLFQRSTRSYPAGGQRFAENKKWTPRQIFGGIHYSEAYWIRTSDLYPVKVAL